MNFPPLKICLQDENDKILRCFGMSELNVNDQHKQQQMRPPEETINNTAMSKISRTKRKRPKPVVEAPLQKLPSQRQTI